MLSTVISGGKVAALAAAALLAMVAWLTITGSVHAQGAFTLSADPDPVEPGGSTTVSVTHTGDAGGVVFDVTYDPLVLSVNETAGAGACNTETSGTVSCSAFSQSGTLDEGAIFTITFDEIGGAEGTTDIGLEVTDCSDDVGDPVEGCTGDSLSLTIAEPTPTPTPEPTASPAPTATPADLPDTGGTPDSGSSNALVYALGALGIALVAAGGFAVSRMKRELS